MKIRCEDYENLLRRSEDPGIKDAILSHAKICRSCGAKWRQWEEISGLAQSLHKQWDSPDLWPRIYLALTSESQWAAQWRSPESWHLSGLLLRNWRVFSVSLTLLALTLSITWVLVRNAQMTPTLNPKARDERSFLTEQALKELEISEAAYTRSIEKLSGLARPGLEGGASPLMMNYREKLMLIDSAIAECRANIERNRYNAYLRMELMSVYREKERTLEELIKENRNEQH